LEEDFGIPDKEMTAVFSGHRGYHIHVENNCTNKLNSMERKEVVDYITATGLKVEHHGLLREKHITSGPAMIDLGWGGRIGKAIYTLLLKDIEELKRIKLTDDIIKKITEKREQILDAWQRGEGWNQLSELKKSAREKIINAALIHGAAFIDTVVTTDTHRLIRLPNTLHGKTGLRVIEMPINKLPDFEPLRDAISFREEFYSINVKDAPSIQIGEKKYGPFKNTSIKLPAAVAMFYLCKNRATLAQSL
ncbi:MAG: DNA primase small subunit domain-containing protein, partial [Candidatus Bathyarchaeota archaeon]